MKHKLCFELAVRVLGLAFVYHGLVSLPDRVGVIFTMAANLSPPGFAISVFLAAWPLMVAYWLLAGAPFLVRIAYPPRSADAGHE